MKLIHRALEKDGAGSIKLRPQEEDDMWHVYNLISKGDEVTSVTFRKVQKVTSTGSTQSQKVKMTVTLRVDSVDFDSQTCSIRLKGINTKESQHIKLGQSHTIQLQLQRDFTLTKPKWDAVYLDRVEVATDPKNRADAAAVVMQPGLAHICLITAHMTILRQKIEVGIPRKRLGSTTNHDKAIHRFYLQVYEAIKRHIDFSIVKVVVVASPAYTNEEFLKTMLDQAVKNEDKSIMDNRQKFVLAHSSSGHKHALKEVLSDPQVANRMGETKAFGEVKALDAFFKMLHDDPDRAFYGFNHVRVANESKAVDVLLVTDELFRNADIKTRQQYVDLVESVKENGGEVHIFSALHVSGEQLAQMTGVAAILRFPLPEIDDVDHGHDSDTDTDDEKKET